MEEQYNSDIFMLGIGTAVPEYRLQQNEVFDRIQASLKDDPDSIRWAKRIFRQCGVHTRYTCEANFMQSEGESRYLSSDESHLVPTTSERMNVYKRESIPLALKAAREAVADAGTDPSRITHVITVSCTGQFLPGMDSVVVQQLGLSARVNRIPLTFQGCAAGLKAIQLARGIVAAAPASFVLVVCVELCTIHFQSSSSREALFGASFFGDGASACVIGSEHSGKRELFRLGEGHSVLLPGTAEEMVWEVGDTGFDLYLSPRIPKLLRTFLNEEVQLLLGEESLPPLWAIHPGGRGIVDTVQEMFSLENEQTSFSRSVLRDYGNLSSATILFVMQQMRRDLLGKGASSEDGVALAFGPGLTAELLKFTFIPSTILKRGARQRICASLTD